MRSQRTASTEQGVLHGDVPRRLPRTHQPLAAWSFMRQSPTPASFVLSDLKPQFGVKRDICFCRI